MRQREAFKHGGAVGVFGVFGFEELAPRRGIEEEFGGSMVVPTGVGGCRRAAEFAVFRFDLCRVRAVFLTLVRVRRLTEAILANSRESPCWQRAPNRLRF